MRIPLLAVAQREIPIPIVPPNFDSLVIFQLQCKLYNIDGTLSGLTADGGFRNYVCRNCREFGLRGFVWRVPKSDGKILASGTKVQLERLEEFLNNLCNFNFITYYEFESGRDFLISRNLSLFFVKKSERKRVETGTYSDSALDDVLSVSTADKVYVGGNQDS